MKNFEDALRDAYLAGFNQTGEGYNAEYPFEGGGQLDDTDWLRSRDEYVRETMASMCRHRIVDVTNEVVKSGYMCMDCGALFGAYMAKGD